MHRQKYHFFSCSTHFPGNHHIAGNSARQPHNSELDPLKIQKVSDWTTTPTTLLVGEGPNPSQPVRIWPFPARSRPARRDPAVLFGERSDPINPGRSFRSRLDPVQLGWIRSFWPGNGRIPSSLPGFGCFGRRTGSPVRPDLSMARGFGPFFSRPMMKGIFVFV
jgi:hypothetical protein